jgi:hypothetical protein
LGYVTADAAISGLISSNGVRYHQSHRSGIVGGQKRESTGKKSPMR